MGQCLLRSALRRTDLRDPPTADRGSGRVRRRSPGGLRAVHPAQQQPRVHRDHRDARGSRRAGAGRRPSVQGGRPAEPAPARRGRSRAGLRPAHQGRPVRVHRRAGGARRAVAPDAADAGRGGADGDHPRAVRDLPDRSGDHRRDRRLVRGQEPGPAARARFRPGDRLQRPELTEPDRPGPRPAGLLRHQLRAAARVPVGGRRRGTERLPGAAVPRSGRADDGAVRRLLRGFRHLRGAVRLPRDDRGDPRRRDQRGGAVRALPACPSPDHRGLSRLRRRGGGARHPRRGHHGRRFPAGERLDADEPPRRRQGGGHEQHRGVGVRPGPALRDLGLAARPGRQRGVVRPDPEPADAASGTATPSRSCCPGSRRTPSP